MLPRLRRDCRSRSSKARTRAKPLSCGPLAAETSVNDPQGSRKGSLLSGKNHGLCGEESWVASALDRRDVLEALASDVWLETKQLERALTAADNAIRLDHGSPLPDTLFSELRTESRFHSLLARVNLSTFVGTAISETSVDVSSRDIYKSVTPGRLARTR